ncbi:helix-turn-helix transcriptional regulator [Burkholderia contaminans]|uniref:helix-turn-helix transcriptional regulator n=1 Tax=Burkholderia contaminans TaxID=488447 RepID=UPI00241676BB|nr:helix-turn-helix transcriptional regulator [Burkholderia contaminans]WFN14448.1 helix-turn-helix domain-containing protein [Burkholderia contaminans]
MSYLDLSDCRFTTDAEGHRLRADVPYKMFSMLLEFRDAALRAQTARIENKARPGSFKASLGPVNGPPLSSRSPSIRGANRRLSGKEARERVEALFARPENVHRDAAPISVPAEMPAVSAEVAGKAERRPPKFFPREFRAEIPEEVATLIEQGIYFLRAWRTYRQLTIADVAELMNVSQSNVGTHELGYSIPSQVTLKRFADIYDCSLEQLTARVDSDSGPPPTQPEQRDRQSYAPAETDYPDVVMGHMLDGKSPLTAWRLYKRMTIQQLARAYGSGQDNIRQLEERTNMREGTRRKLADVLQCKPVQLLLPAGFERNA